MPKNGPSIVSNTLHTTAIAVVLFFFASCSEEKSLVQPGAGASLSDQQKKAAADIDAMIGQQLGDTDGLCKSGYGSYEKCFKQEIYRLLTKYYHTSVTKLAGNVIAGPALPAPVQTVFEIDVPELAADDVIYLIADFAIYAPTSTGLLFSVELVHIDNDAAQTKTVLDVAHSSLSGNMKYKRVPMTGVYSASGATRPGKFALQVQTSIPVNSDWIQGIQTLKLDSSSQLTALHYKAFTVDDIFSDESKASGHYQSEGYSHSTLASDLALGGPAAKQTKNTIVGTGKKLLDNLIIKDLEKDDILVLRFSGSFDYFDSFTGCSDVPKIIFSFASASGSTLTPVGKAMPLLLSQTGNSAPREADVQFVHGIHVYDILEDKSELNLTVKVDQEGAGSADCKLTFRNDANSTALTYELYRPISKLKNNFYLGKFLAEVASIHDKDERQTSAANYSQASIPAESFATTPSIPLMGGDVVFSDGSFNLDVGVLGTASSHINSEISLKEVLLGSNTPTSHTIRHSLNGRHAREHLYVHRALDIFESLIPSGQRQSGRFQVKGKFISGVFPDASTDSVPIKITDSSAHFRIFRQFDSEDKAEKAAD